MKNKKSKPVLVPFASNEKMVESLIFTRAQTGGNLYRQRFLLRLMELAQSQIKANLPAVHGHSRLFFDSSYDPVIEIPVSAILDNGSGAEYMRAKKAILDFSSWVLVHEDAENFTVIPVLRRSNLSKLGGVFQFKLEREVWECMFNFSKGFSVYNLKVALAIENELALKIYKGLEKQNGEMFYTFDAFRKAYGFTKRYVGRNHDLVKCMIEPAKQELDAKSPWTFDYTLSYGYKEGCSRGRKSLVGINIIPVHRLGREGMDGVRKNIHPSELIGKDVYRILTEKMYFTFSEVKANLKVLELGAKHLGEGPFADWLNLLAPRAIRANSSTQGYVVNSLKIFLRKKFGIDCGSAVSVVPSQGTEDVTLCFPEENDADVQDGVCPAESAPHVEAASSVGRRSAKDRADVSVDGVVSMGDLFSSMSLTDALGL